jgi:hypothetical protein
MRTFFAGCAVFFLFLGVGELEAQPCNPTCNLTVDVTASPILVCNPPVPVQLNGTINGSYQSFQWIPATGLSNPNILNPVATVTSTITYKLRATEVSTNNLIVNGNFSAGNTGFSTDYNYVVDLPGVQNEMWNEGTYAVIHNPNLVHTGFQPCGDHTSGNGNMMVLNGASNFQDIWCQTINVCPNTEYRFSAWAASVNPASPARLQFSINGNLIGPIFMLTSSTCLWQQFYTQWNSGGNTTAQICITNQNFAPGGNDFAIDDLGFYEVCVVEDEVTIDVFNVQAVANASGQINCNNATVTLDGNGSSTGPNITYLWTTSNGHIVSGATTLNPVVDQGGTYTLTVTYNNNGNNCTKTAQVTVIANTTPPIAAAQAPGQLTCTNFQVTLSGAGSSTGSNISYQWTTTNGNIVSGQNSLNPVVDAAGNYTLQVTNNANGCSSTVSVTITENTTPPTAQANAPAQLDCRQNQTVTINSSGSSTGTNFAYNWSTPDGHILSGWNTLTPTVDEPGTYTLTVTNQQNGCQAQVDVVVGGDKTPPDAAAEVWEELNCTVLALDLDGSGSSTGPNYTYQWTTSNGHIASGATTLYPSVNQPGVYFLTVTNQANGCISQASVQVSQNINYPVAQIEPPGMINCFNSEIYIDAGGSSSGGNFDYLWTTSNGSILSGETTLNPLVGAAGSYTLEILNTDNGCSETATVTVSADLTAPVASALPPPDIDCRANSTVTINASSSSQGAPFTYFWHTPDGIVLSGFNTLTPRVGAPGTYTLRIFNQQNGCEIELDVEVGGDNTRPVADAQADEDITCFSSQVTLDGSGSDTGNFTYLWSTTSGHIVSGSNTLFPLVDRAGLYRLTITNPATGCASTAMATVNDFSKPPKVKILPPDTITCFNPEVQLDGKASDQGASYQFVWSTTGGHFSSGSNGLSPKVDAPGQYRLVISNQDNGCIDSAEVTVVRNVVFPLAAIRPAAVLTCQNPEIQLDASSSTRLPQLKYQWTTDTGRIVTGATSLTPKVSADGIYRLVVTDTLNGCRDTADVLVQQHADFPVVDAGRADTLSCSVRSLKLSGAFENAGQSPALSWRTADGVIVSGAASASPTIDAPGRYIFTVLNAENGCLSEDTVQILQSLVFPQAEAGTGNTFTCDLLQLQLSGTGSTVGDSVSYAWTTNSGNILFGESTLSPTVNAPGTYLITVVHVRSGCSATDSVEILRDNRAPLASIAPPATLTCTVRSVQLDASQSSSGGSYTFAWSTTNGQFATGQTTLRPSVDAPGTYALQVTDLQNGCKTTTSVLVVIDTIAPFVDPGVGFVLNCKNLIAQLDGLASSSGSQFQFNWSTWDGRIVDGANTLTPAVSSGGTYVLSIHNLQNGCYSAGQVVIQEDFWVPELRLEPFPTLTCAVTAIDLQASVINDPAVQRYTWTLPDQTQVINTSGQLQTSVSGNYSLSVENLRNFCSSSMPFTVEEDIRHPRISISPPDTLTCIRRQVTLSGNSSPAAPVSINWVTLTGNLVSGRQTPSPIVDAPGWYVFSVRNTENGCASVDSVFLSENVVTPTVVVQASDTLTCIHQNVTLDATKSSAGQAFDYRWTTIGGHFTSGQLSAQPEVDAPGVYQLEILDNRNGCTANASIEVIQNADFPTVVVASPPVINCFARQINLDAAGTSTGAQFRYEWTTSTGRIDAGANTLTPLISSPGQYIIEVTNLDNACRKLASVEVAADTLPPVATLQADGQITCVDTVVAISVKPAGDLTTYRFDWTTQDGQISQGQASANPRVTASGLYQVQVTSLQNGCSGIFAIPISSNTALPQLNLRHPDTLTCRTRLVQLDCQASGTGGGFSYAWSTMGGHFQSGQNSSSPVVDNAGFYAVTVIDLVNGCQQTAQVEVLEDKLAPIALAAVSEKITCFRKEVTLSGAGSSAGLRYAYTWTTPNGMLLSGQQSLASVAGKAGTYRLSVLDVRNGCESSASVVVEADTLLPRIVVATPGLLTCKNLSLTLDATAGDWGQPFDFQWKTSGNGILTGANSPTPVVNQPGQYQLTVVNRVNGCLSSDDVQVAQDIRRPVVHAGPDLELNCRDTIVTLMGTISAPSGQYTHRWYTADGSISGNATSQTITTSLPGVYDLLATDLVNGCEASDLARVVRDTNILVSIEPRIQPPLCWGDRGVIQIESVVGGTPPFQFSVDGGEHFSQRNLFQQLPFGKLSILVRDAKGCEILEEVEIPSVEQNYAELPAEIRVALGDQATLQLETNLTPDRIASVEWAPAEGLSCQNCISPTLIGTNSQTYTVTITDVNGCKVSARTVVLVAQELDVYIPSAFSPNNQDGVNDIFLIFAKAGIVSDVHSFLVFNRWGEVVFESYHFLPNDPAFGWNGYFRGSLQNPAVFVYFADIKFIDGSRRIFKGDVTLVY